MDPWILFYLFCGALGTGIFLFVKFAEWSEKKHKKAHLKTAHPNR